VQSGQGTSQSYGQSTRTRTANYGATAAATSSNSEVEQFMANCLLAQNEAEVQLTQLAEQQAQSSDVKQFAQKMAQDHRQMIQQLQQIAGTQSGSSSRLGGRSGSTSSTSSDTTGSSSRGSSTGSANDTNSAGTTTSRSSGVGAGTSGTSGIGTAGSSTTGSTALPGTSGASGTAGTTGRSSLSSSQTTDLAGGVASASSGGAVQQLMQIDRQILDRKTQLTKDDLQQKQGSEFDKCFVATVIPAHVHAVAELEVLEKQGGQLAQIAQQARPIVQQHLDHAKQLMRQLDNQSSGSSTSQAERSSSRRER